MLSLEDRQAIVDVTVRYCWAIDDRDYADLANVFTEDAAVDYGSKATFKGVAAVQEYVAKVLTPLDSSQHLVSNHLIDTDAGDIRSRCLFPCAAHPS